MIIPVNKDFQISVDDRCYTLQQKKVKGADEKSLSRLVDASKAGEIYWVDLGYYMDIEHALKRFTHVEIARCKDLAEFRQRFAELKQDIVGVRKALEV